MKWKKILLVVANYKTTGYDFYDSAFPPLALEYIASYVEDIVDVIILDTKAANLNLTQFKQKLEAFNPDLVGLTVPVTSAIDSVLIYARIAKLTGCTTVIGGWHPTLAVEQTLSSPWIDILVRGEGEFTFRELIEKGSPENIKGLSYKINGQIIHNPERPFLKNLDELKFPSRHLVKNYTYKIFNMNCDAIETSRGCPQGCRFCSTHVVYKRRWRARSIENVMKELEIISKNKKIRDIFFVDDNILVDMKRVGRLCIEIIRAKREGTLKKKLRFFFQGRLDSMARYPYITKLMDIAGFWLVLVGVEATDDKTLELIDKGCKLESIKKGIQVLHESGIMVMGNVIIGANLEDTIDDVFITIKRTRELDLDLPSFTLLTPFPSTDFYNELKQKNLLLSEDYSKYNWLNPVIKTEKLNPRALKLLLFLGFFYINYYGGGWVNKLKLFYRNTKSRGLKFTFHPIRFFRTSLSYYRWRCIVHYHLRELNHKIHQIKFGNLKDMKELRTAILEIGNE
ncbi:MAG: radical SAM protein [Promethearchaeota archaeon]|nr:MAG: radical SAM protein [Candidatus Lokiarchaeota archaeon]